MIESISDALSFGVLLFFCIYGLWILYAVHFKHHEESMRKREAMYYQYYEEAEDDPDEEDRLDPYYGD